MLINEKPLTVADKLFFDFQDAFTLEHDGEDIAGGGVLGIILLYEFAKERFRSVFLNRLDNWSGRCKDGLPMGNKTFSFASALAELGLPAIFANVHAAQFCALVKKQRVKRLFISKRPAAGFAHGRT